ncbi:MAG: prephenate dehydrogenase [Bacteroidia bacterium]|nr:prephenate dehydrogenase [Bacteroidia bacterium]
MKLTIIGPGLIGGSLAKDLRARGFAKHIIGVDNNSVNAKQAVELGIVDEARPFAEAVKAADVVLVCVPVDVIEKILPSVLDTINSNAVVIDLGSTKSAICKAVEKHPKRKQFVAAHPIAGTENSGPSAAINNLFDNKTCIICEQDLSSKEALSVAQKLFGALKMNLIYMEANEHDIHLAYISHLPHVISFAMVNTVLEAEKDFKSLFNLAGSGFASLTRLAKSSPDMWTPIFRQNSENVINSIDAYISELELFKQLVKKKDSTMLHQMMERSNEVRKVLPADKK